jgi:hypothetical protein
MIGAVGLVAAIAAAEAENFAAVYVAIGCSAIVYMLHAIEFKLHKPLDHHGVFVHDRQIARD